jgi:hypothetical protein
MHTHALSRQPCVSRSEVYKEGASLNEGTFGVVFKATLKDKRALSRGDDGTRALKRLKPAKQPGFPVTALREIVIMKQLVPDADSPHPNIGVLREVVMDPGALT